MDRADTISIRDGAHDPRAIANYILRLREEAGKPTTIMQLIKLVYLCDGWSLALLDRPLSKHNAQAWKFGPVYPTVYTAFKRYGSSPIRERAVSPETGLPYSANFSADEISLMQAVVDAYGRLSAWQLSSLTHQEDSPWSIAFRDGAYSTIEPEVMAAHFKKLKESRGNYGF